MIKLFFTAFLQVTLVAMNISFISHNMIFLMLVSSFGLSLCWCYNVKSEYLNTIYGKLVYSLGACIGTGVGYILAKQFINLI